MNVTTKKIRWLNKANVSQHLKLFLAVLILLSLAAGLRAWPLQAFESELPWLTFYPVVIVVALYGGLYARALATALACVAVTILWPLFAGHPFIKNRFDLLDMAIFALICSFISYLSEAVHRSSKELKRACRIGPC